MLQRESRINILRLQSKGEDLGGRVMAMKERRRFRRYDIAQFAKYRKISGYMNISSLATIKNIGFAGLCALVSNVVGKGDRLLIELYLPLNKKLTVLAEVVWAQPLVNARGNICGVRFLSASSVPLLVCYIAYAKDISAAA